MPRQYPLIRATIIFAYSTLENRRNFQKRGIEMDEILRKQVRHFLADHEDITKKELAEYLEIRPDSFYNWLDR